MKRKLFKVVILIMAVALLLSACGNNNDVTIPAPPDVEPSESNSEIMEFFPFWADTLFAYQGYPDERFNQLTFAGFIEARWKRAHECAEYAGRQLGLAR